MNKKAVCLFLLGLSAVCMPPSLFGGGKLKTNPPGCDPTQEDCGCSCDQVSADCIKVNIGLGETTPWTGSLSCSLKIFADDDLPSIFTPESLHAVLGGYTFKRLGQKTMADGVTPAEVVLSHPNGEAVHFVFANGESLGRPDPGVHIKMDARLQMVDSEGWATTHDPVYYDLYVGDGSRRRFLATNATGALGALVSITDERGVTTTPADMGVDIIYDPDGVRQYLTPSRLANVTRTADFLGYDVAIYALQEPPQKDTTTGLYVVPAGQTVEHVSVRRENGGKRAVVTIRKGGGDPLRYVFDYAMNEWSLTRPSGMQERKECLIADGVGARITKTVVSSLGEVLAKKVKNYKWMSWGFAMTNRVEGFDGVTDTTAWTYYTSGNGKGQVKSEKRQSGLLTQYVYDNLDRLVSKTRSGPDMMTELTTYDYTPVDANDPVLPVDTRPRTVIRKLNNIECERTYYVYSPLTNIVERVGTQGAAYGGTNVLRTVTAFYPVAVNDPRSGFVASVRYEDGKLDLYDYELSSNIWVRMVTHLHEQSPLPVSGKTTRDAAITNRRGEVVEMRTEAYIDGVWYTIARNQMAYNFEGKRVTSENLAGQVTTTAWDCCHKVSEVQPDGSTMTWDYDADGHVIASSRLIPLDMTNVTWLTTCYRYDDLGRQVATWRTNFTAQVGLPVECTRYDALGRVAARVDQLGNTTTTTYGPDGRTVSVQNPNTSTVVYSRSAGGDTLSIVGTAVTPEFHTYGILSDGTRWSRTVQGETASSPRFTKRYENLLGQIVREEHSGFQGAVLATINTYDTYGRIVSTAADYEPTIEYTYDLFGNRVATTRMVGRGDLIAPPSPDTQWRKSESLSHIAIIDGALWLIQTNIVSCSDSAIAPLATSSARQLTGLTAALPTRSRTTDIRGNVTENETLVDSSTVTSRQTLPCATNKPLAISRYGVSLMDVSVSAVTNTVAYDSLGRRIANTDGRGNTRHAEYNSLGQRSASIDALGNRTVYAYDQFGNLDAVTDPLGHAIVYEYDLRGRKIYEGGATYPVRYTYDVFGNKTTMMTYRNESLGPDSGDVTTWLYDEASGAMTNKVYADGRGPTYTYTDSGLLAKREWARGVITTYSYDGWNNLTSTVYSDGTPTISFVYDALERQISSSDAVGTTTTDYDGYDCIASESIHGLFSRVLLFAHDQHGRDVGYSIDNLPQCVIEYEEESGRVGRVSYGGEWYTYSYVPGTDIKSSLSIGSIGRMDWTYESHRDLLTQVKNTAFGNIVSQFDYTSDATGRRIEIGRSGAQMSVVCTNAYCYNDRNELTNAIKNATSTECACRYDDIGNRLVLSRLGINSSYTANSLNQYTHVSNCCWSVSLDDDFCPLFDSDGNQIVVKTSTGIWSVTYNGENRPILWSNGDTNITMKYDRMGRRVEYAEIFNGVTNIYHHFVYNGYLCVQRLDASADNATELLFGWDPTERVLTRPLWMECAAEMHNFFYLHDGSKNVSDVVPYPPAYYGASAHYEYTAFGVETSENYGTAIAEFRGAEYNPFRFSSEYTDRTLGLVYYNYRHYNPTIGRWITRDLFLEYGGLLLYGAFSNAPYMVQDVLGLKNNVEKCSPDKDCFVNIKALVDGISLSVKRYDELLNPLYIIEAIYDLLLPPERQYKRPERFDVRGREAWKGHIKALKDSLAHDSNCIDIILKQLANGECRCCDGGMALDLLISAENAIFTMQVNFPSLSPPWIMGGMPLAPTMPNFSLFASNFDWKTCGWSMIGGIFVGATAVAIVFPFDGPLLDICCGAAATTAFTKAMEDSQ